MRRENSNHAGLRALLIASMAPGWDKWRVPGRVCEMERGLRGGGAVTLSSAQLARAYRFAGVDGSMFDFGGENFGKVYQLDTKDRLTEVGGPTA